jgi:hypothetical protein
MQEHRIRQSEPGRSIYGCSVKVGAGDTAVQGDMLLPANVKISNQLLIALKIMQQGLIYAFLFCLNKEPPTDEQWQSVEY